NLDLDQERTLVLDLRGRAVAGHSAQVLTAEAAGTYNTPEQPDAVAPRPLEAVREHERGLEITLPPHSFATVELQLGECRAKAAVHDTFPTRRLTTGRVRRNVILNRTVEKGRDGRRHPDEGLRGPRRPHPTRPRLPPHPR